MSLAFHFHDLKNKLAIVYFMLECAKVGRIPHEEQVTAIIQRIDEILSEISNTLKVEPVALNLDVCGYEGFWNFLQFAVQKLSKLYPEIHLTVKDGAGKWAEEVHVSLNLAMLYQVVENAVENSKNAHATQVILTLAIEDSQPTLILSDDGEGFQKTLKPTPQEKIVSGRRIISENLKVMGAVGVYSENQDRGVKLTITFNAEVTA